AVLVALVAAPARCARLIERLSARWPRLRQRALSVFETFVRGLDGIRAPSHALPILVWTAILWVIPAAAASMMLTAMNLSLPWIAGWAVLAFVGLGISIPSAPGYVGVFHAAAALAVGLFGVAQAAAVVSAMGKTTDGLVALAHQVSPSPEPREMDMLLATGEQVTIALLAMALQSLGLRARSFTGFQAAIRTDRAHTRARITQISTERVRQSLDAGEIAVVAGFQGLSDEDEITTLGRGGSDLTTVALAAALKAEVCEIYTDVDGVYTA